MKVYSFFLIAEEVPKDFIFIEEYGHCLKESYKGFNPTRKLDDGRNAILYAITNKPEYAEAFKDTRDLNKLVLFKSNMKKDKYQDLLNNYNFKEFKIKNEILLEGTTGKSQKEIRVILTEFEREKINDELLLPQLLWEKIFGEKGDGNMIPLEVFNKNIRTLLEGFLYEELSLMISELGANNGDLEYAELENIRRLLKIEEGFKLNTFSIFVELFKCVLK